MTINNKSERNYRGKCLGWPVTSYGAERVVSRGQRDHGQRRMECVKEFLLEKGDETSGELEDDIESSSYSVILKVLMTMRPVSFTQRALSALPKFDKCPIEKNSLPYFAPFDSTEHALFYRFRASANNACIWIR